MREAGGPELCFIARWNTDGVTWSLSRLRVRTDEALLVHMSYTDKRLFVGTREALLTSPSACKHSSKVKGNWGLLWWFLWPDADGDHSELCRREAEGGQCVPNGHQDLCLFVHLHKTFSDTSGMPGMASAQIKVTSWGDGCSGHLDVGELGRPYTGKYCGCVSHLWTLLQKECVYWPQRCIALFQLW